MNKYIHIDSDFAGYSAYSILDEVKNCSHATVYHQLKYKNVLELINKHFGKLRNTTRTDYTVFADNEDEIIPFYSYNVKIGKDIALTYELEDISNDDEDIENINVGTDTIIEAEYCSDLNIYYNAETEEQYKSFMAELNSCIYKEEKKKSFYTIGVNTHGFDLMTQEANIDNDMDIELHYGKSFLPVYDSIINNLKTKYHGLILLYGEPGTGKTQIIRHIISKLCNDKKIIYVPAYMIEQFANPEFITFIQKNKESILVLEDAEFALQSRNEEYGAQAVSNLLNITNGLLNDAVKIQVIATFNMEKKKIDSALLRPGRLINEWKFDALPIKMAQKLAKEIAYTKKITKPMTVAELYSEPIIKQEDKKMAKKNRIGFDK